MVVDEMLAFMRIAVDRVGVTPYEDYDESKTYQLGFKTIWHDNIYRTTVPHDGEVFNISHNELYIHTPKINEYDSTIPYMANIYFKYNNGLYRTLQNHQAMPFNRNSNLLIYGVPNTPMGLFANRIHTDVGVRNITYPQMLVPVIGDIQNGMILFDEELNTYLITEVDNFSAPPMTLIDTINTTFTITQTYLIKEIIILNGGSGYTDGAFCRIYGYASIPFEGTIHCSGGRITSITSNHASYEEDVGGDNLALSETFTIVSGSDPDNPSATTEMPSGGSGCRVTIRTSFI